MATLTDLARGTAAEWLRKAASRLGGQAPSRRDGREDLEPGMPKPAAEEGHALRWDPMGVMQSLGFQQRPTGLTYHSLRQIARTVPPVAAIHQVRIYQAANFGIPARSKADPGYAIRIRDVERNPTRAEKKEADRLSSWLRWTGSTRGAGKDSFETFLKRAVRDSLSYDQLCWENQFNRKGELCDFYAVDAATIRIADKPPHVDVNDQGVRFVQVYDEVAIAEFTADELAFGVRNPDTDLRNNGYGTAESEMLVRVVTGLLNGLDYNVRFFDQGTTTKGLINLKGALSPKKLAEFRAQWYEMISGVVNAWRTPILNAEEVQYINLHSTNRDMEFSAFMDWLLKMCCAVWLMDPAELNFLFGNTGQTSQMFQAPQESKIRTSKDRGLAPLLRFLAEMLNRNVVWRVNEDFELVWSGLDVRSGAEAAELQNKQVRCSRTVDEIRAEDDMPPLPDGKGKIILDPTWYQMATQVDAAKQQEQQGGEQGDGAPGDGGGAAPDGQDQGPGDQGDEPEDEQGDEQSPWADVLKQFDDVGASGGEED